MEIEYVKNNDDRECMAFIDQDNDLWVNLEGLWRCVTGTFYDDILNEDDAIHKFYPGDKITITF
jgi:hypothetical protein